MLNRLAVALAFLFLIPAFALAAIPTSVAGESCGTWTFPRFTDIEVVMQRADIVMGGDGLPPELLRAECEDKLAPLRFASLGLLFLGIGAPLTIWYVVGAKRGK